MCLPIALDNSPVFLPSSQEAKINHCQGWLQGTAKAFLAFLKGLLLKKKKRKKKFDFFPPGLIFPFLCPFLPTKGRAFHFPARDNQKGLAPSRFLSGPLGLLLSLCSGSRRGNSSIFQNYNE